MRPTPAHLRDALAELDRSDAVRPIDVALARLLGSIEAEHDAAASVPVALAAALASVLARDGHSTVALADWAGGPFPGEAAVGAPPTLPAASAWRDALSAARTVGAPGDAAPLVLDGGRLSLARFWNAERRLGRGLSTRLAGRAAVPAAMPPGAQNRAPEDGEPETVRLPGGALPITDAVRARMARLFPPRGAGAEPDWQAVAAAAALRQRVLFVAGGPGTGKTYTAARLLSLVQAAAPELDVALAAPTGKAARRLGESLDAAAGALGGDAVRLRHAPQTLHALLGASRTRPGFRHGPARPLPHDLVLVDEGSMVSLPLFDALLAALAPTARLVVLGDPDQLESVEAGAVFGDVCALGAGGFTAEGAAHAAALGHAAPAADAPAPLADAVVTLTESRRFAPGSGVGRLAAALRDGDAEGVRAALAAGGDARAVEAEPAAAAVAWALDGARAVIDAPSPAEALRALGRRQLLAAVRRGPRGVEGLNAAVEAALRAERRVRWSPRGGPPRRAGEPFHGQPLLVTENRHGEGLANGDVGVCWEAGGARTVAFPDGAGGVRHLPVGQLPPTEPAWALTVHKSQGSEFDAVGVVLPDPARLRRPLTRGLLYTAVTRARESVVVFGAIDEAAAAAARASERGSGLRAELAARLGA